MSKSNRTKKNSKAIKKSEQDYQDRIKSTKKNTRFDSDKFLNKEEQLELLMKQQGLL